MVFMCFNPLILKPALRKSLHFSIGLLWAEIKHYLFLTALDASDYIGVTSLLVEKLGADPRPATIQSLFMGAREGVAQHHVPNEVRM